MNQLLIGMDSNALREFLNPEGADSEKLCQERATEQAYYQGKEALAVFHAFEKAYGNIENGDSHRYQKVLLYGNGLRTSYTYDERSQLTGMESVLKDGRILHKASYSYDNAGNRITQSTDGRTEKYFYNNRNQLTELHREKDVVRYSYDPAGNLTEENYLTADGTSTKRLHYAYDVYNRNVSVTGDDFTQKNHYDAEGYRDSITEKDKVTNFVYQGGMLLHELDEDKNPARHYVLGNDENLRMRFGKKDKGEH